MTPLTTSSTILNDNSLYVKWDSKFEIGIPIIDDQHKCLIGLCNSFYQELMKTRNLSETNSEWQKSLVSALKACVDYVSVHFSTEEKLMIASGFPEYKQHKKEHDIFTQKVLEVSCSFYKIQFSDALNFVKFLYDWIFSHIAHSDKLFVNSILEYYKMRKTEG